MPAATSHEHDYKTRAPDSSLSSSPMSKWAEHFMLTGASHSQQIDLNQKDVDGESTRSQRPAMKLAPFKSYPIAQNDRSQQSVSDRRPDQQQQHPLYLQPYLTKQPSTTNTTSGHSQQPLLRRRSSSQRIRGKPIARQNSASHKSDYVTSTTDDEHDAYEADQSIEPIMLIYADNYLPVAAATASRSMRNLELDDYDTEQDSEDGAERSPEFLFAMTPPSAQHYLSLEELKSARNSCWLCGCNWSEAHVSLDCPECGGYALERPCPNCDGKCKQTWKRNVTATHDRHQALWTGECLLAKSTGAPLKVPTGKSSSSSKAPVASSCCSSQPSSVASSDCDESDCCCHCAIEEDEQIKPTTQAAAQISSATTAEQSQRNGRAHQKHLCVCN